MDEKIVSTQHRRVCCGSRTLRFMLPDENAESAFRILDPRLEPPPLPPPPPESQFFMGVPFLTLRLVGGSCSAAGLRGAAFIIGQ